MPTPSLFARERPRSRRFRPSILVVLVSVFLGSAVSCFAEEAPVPSTLPYLTGFEATDSIIAGPINGQGLWTADTGVLVTTMLANWGEQSVILPAAATPLHASLSFAAALDLPIVFVDFYILPTASVGLDAFIQIEGAKIAFVQAGAGQADIYVFNGDGNGGGSWEPTGCRLPVGANQQPASWLRLTVREDFSTQSWSLYLDAELKASGKGFINSGKAFLSELTLIGQTSGPNRVDDLLVGFDNPMFTDLNNNGVDDVLESPTASAPSEDDLPLSPVRTKPPVDGVDSSDTVLPIRPPIPIPLPNPASLVRLQVFLPRHR